MELNWWLKYLFEMVEGSQDDLMPASHETHSSQELQNQGFGPSQYKTHTNQK